ncbi:DUF6431 domain-containing protein [Anaerolactibacter massiliensis]|uniref:DUF6431 domain-containing protein n=1 Tax=Anaerolactibacter massiliensis TaxID=2044573 RepID=UPI003B838014
MPEKKAFLIRSNETCVCPVCQSDLLVRDSVRRKVKDTNGSVSTYIIRRLKCSNSSCNRIHRELPDFCIPFRRYESIIIEEAIDEAIHFGDSDIGEYPCERTFQRWKTWEEENKQQIDGNLNSIVSHFDSSGSSLRNGAVSLLEHFRKRIGGWLSEIYRAIINFGSSLPRGDTPVLSSCLSRSGISSFQKEDHNEQPENRGLAGCRGTEKVSDDCPFDGSGPGLCQENSDP